MELLAMPFEKAMLVSYWLSIVTLALSLTIPPQFASLESALQEG